ncbi:unnamed protein product [Orchesella dallaii]|uniref:Uncharacterized protein n=1 Tax=Orchesella dallaii TaxID=48710 RepID=A0ABP1PZV9_9HEXA
MMKSTTDQRFEKARGQVRIVAWTIFGFNCLLLLASIVIFWAQIGEWDKSEIKESNRKIFSFLIPVGLAMFVSLHQIFASSDLLVAAERGIRYERAIKIVYSHLHMQIYILVAESLILCPFAYNGVENNGWDLMNLSCIAVMLTLCGARLAGWIIVHNFGNVLQVALIGDSEAETRRSKPVLNA